MKREIIILFLLIVIPNVIAIPNEASNSIEFTYSTPINYSQVPMVNTSNFWDSLDTPADINTGDITDDGTYWKSDGDSTVSGNWSDEGNGYSLNWTYGLFKYVGVLFDRIEFGYFDYLSWVDAEYNESLNGMYQNTSSDGDNTYWNVILGENDGTPVQLSLVGFDFGINSTGYSIIAENLTTLDNQICNATTCFTLQDLNNTGSSITLNSSEFETDGSTWSLNKTWLGVWWDSIWNTKTTDGLTEGSTNKYDNQSWNETYANNLYQGLGVNIFDQSLNTSKNVTFANVNNINMTSNDSNTIIKRLWGYIGSTLRDRKVYKLNGGDVVLSPTHPVHFGWEGAEGVALSTSTSGGCQFSNANGETGCFPNDVAPCDGVIYELWLSCLASSSSGQVNVTVEGVVSDCAVNTQAVSSHGGDNYFIDVSQCNLEVNDGDGIYMKTTISDSSALPCRIGYNGRCY